MNFTNIGNAIKAIEGIKNKPDYSNLRIAHGKDRCANPPRNGPQGMASGMRRSTSGGGRSPGNSNAGAHGDFGVDGEGLENGGEGIDNAFEVQPNIHLEALAVGEGQLAA